MTAPHALALFDLDHTLLPFDSDYQWAAFLARTGRAGDPIEAQRRNDELMQRYNEGVLNAYEAAEFMLGLLTLTGPRELVQWHEDYMAEIVSPQILPQAQELIAQHQANGDICVIVTATNEFVTRPIADALNIPHLIATIPERDGERYTGRIHGTPSFKEGKVTRVQQWLSDQNLSLGNFSDSWFYSDSLNDLPLLEAVSKPVATNPSPALRAIAHSRGWQVLDLFEDLQDTKS
ncbi:HAD-IB family hydrolase [Alcaligenaceae bacterium CGII-47]|nr:HAD-IB family hydrolase [Alcaligenaceae bacterium CGII-47]